MGFSCALWRTHVQIYFHPVHMARQTLTFFPCNHNLFSDSNYEAPHYALFPKPAYVLSVSCSTHSPEHPSFCVSWICILWTEGLNPRSWCYIVQDTQFIAGVYPTGCYNYLPYIVSIASAHMYRFLIGVSVTVTKWLDGSEKCPFAPTTNHLYIALKTGSILRVLQKTVSETVSANVTRREWVLYPPTFLLPLPYATLLCNQ